MIVQPANTWPLHAATPGRAASQLRLQGEHRSAPKALLKCIAFTGSADPSGAVEYAAPADHDSSLREGAVGAREAVKHRLGPCAARRCRSCQREYRAIPREIPRAPESGGAVGSGANLQMCEIRWVLLCEMEIGSGYAARAACQISGIVAVSPPSLLM